ncbi:hypothetical protein GHK86_17170 [Acidimicrobiaceae bacterium USS-CC1]|uniref:Uncharacterized protein n=1 Tax=Acidiferrimicrobium australe TaxID=2664430 RepID=A0ABW9QXS0_9ACTN|nr:hypothetical protein [Acidiferrimicrobium australe]
MPPAASKAPVDYLAAAAVGILVMVVTIWVQPAGTRWVVFAVGALILLSALAAGARPSRPSDH